MNQLLVHVGNTPAELIAYCQSRNILVQAYSPIAHGEILKSTDVAAIAERYSVTVPQLCIRYTLQLGTVSLPKTANPDHMRENADVDFVITDGRVDHATASGVDRAVASCVVDVISRAEFPGKGTTQVAYALVYRTASGQ